MKPGHTPAPVPMEPGRTPTSVRPEPVEGLAKASAGTAARSPLAELNAHIAQASQAASRQVATASTALSAGAGASEGRWPELRSAQRFRETWERVGAEQAVAQATHRAPENAGPLNSHMLVLRTLGLMRELSPDYLRRFLSHAETLMWLEQEQAQAQLKAPAGKAKVKTARQKK